MQKIAFERINEKVFGKNKFYMLAINSEKLYINKNEYT